MSAQEADGAPTLLGQSVAKSAAGPLHALLILAAVVEFSFQSGQRGRRNDGLARGSGSGGGGSGRRSRASPDRHPGPASFNARLQVGPPLSASPNLCAGLWTHVDALAKGLRSRTWCHNHASSSSQSACPRHGRLGPQMLAGAFATCAQLLGVLRLHDPSRAREAHEFLQQASRL